MSLKDWLIIVALWVAFIIWGVRSYKQQRLVERREKAFRALLPFENIERLEMENARDKQDFAGF